MVFHFNDIGFFLVDSLVVTFDAASQGNLAMVIYEWADVQYLGKETTTDSDEGLPVSYGSRLLKCTVSTYDIYIAENVHLHIKCRSVRLLHIHTTRSIHRRSPNRETCKFY